MSLGRIFARQLWEETLQETKTSIFVLLWPLIVTGATLVGGYLQGSPPLAYLIMAASLSFMAVSIGVLVSMLLIYQSRGQAQPSHGQYIHNPSEGFVGEAVGLTSQGYGQITLKGRTPAGQEASFGKPIFSESKEENARRQERPRSLRVYFEQDETEEEFNLAVAQSLVDFYGTAE